MTKQFIELLENSGLSKTEFCQAIGMHNTHLTRYINQDVEMGQIHFKHYKEKLDNYLKTKIS